MIDKSRELIVLIVVAGYPLLGAIVAGLFKRLVGGTDIWVFLFWPLFVGVAPFLALLWIYVKVYEVCAGKKDGKESSLRSEVGE